MAIQSSRWEQSMNLKLTLMTEAAARAASLQSSSAENQALALKNQEAATVDEEQATELEADAAALLEKANADTALAESEQVGVEELEAEIAAEEEQTVAHAAKAALDEATVDADVAEGTADAAEATRIEAQAHGEEIGIGVCEVIPILDLVCDWVGGVTAIGLEVSAAAEVAKAAAEVAAAAAAKADEDAELTLAAEMQAKVAEDTTAATELQAEEAEVASLAEEEEIQAEEEEAKAEQLFAESEAEEEAAAEEEAEAASEEAAAEEAGEEALEHGVKACWDGVMAAIVGMGALGFFTIRFAFSFLVPAAIHTTSMVYSVINHDPCSPLKSIRASEKYVSYYFHHFAIFLLAMGSMSGLLVGMNGYGLRARGGIILLFAFTAGIFQALIMHALPRGLRSRNQVCQILLDSLKRTLFFTSLFSLEILILWVNLGNKIFSTSFLSWLDKWWLWAFFILTLAAHIWFLELPNEDYALAMLTSTLHEKQSLSSHEVEPENSDKQPSESDSLLPSKSAALEDNNQAAQESTPLSSTPEHDLLLQNEIHKLQLPLEILVLSCMIALLRHCLPSIRLLWPVSKELLLHSRPGWLIPFCVACCILIVSIGILHQIGK